MKTNTIYRTSVYFLIFILVSMPIAFSADINSSNSSNNSDSNLEENQQVFISINVPEYVPSKTITLSGMTNPMARVDLYVNEELKRSSSRNPDGTFSFPSVELNSVSPNKIRFVSENLAKETAQKEFTVIVDNKNPKIIATIPKRVNKKSVDISGSVSKQSSVEILVNNNIYTTINDTTQFNVNVGLSEGENIIKIVATDKAGNTDETSDSVFVDTTELKLHEISPKQGSMFYEGYAISDIEGVTKPLSKVELYVGDKRGDPEYETTSDSSGYFKIEDVDIEKYSLYATGVDLGGSNKIVGVSADTGVGFETSYNPVDYGTEGVESDLGGIKQDTTSVSLYFKLTNNDKSITEEVSYRIGTCFSGALDWSVQNLIEYQSPSSLSPERLAEGTELITSILQFDYVGSSSNASIKSVSFNKFDCSSPTVQNDERYSLACKILPNTPYKKPNDDKSLWYLRYDLRTLEGQDNFSQDLWEDLTRQMTFLLKMKIHYTYMDEEGLIRSDMQQVCMPLSYHLDTSRIDPRDVLPDWLTDEGLNAINTSIEKLNGAIDVTEKVVKYAGIGCLASFGLKTLTVISRRMAEWTNFFNDKIDPNKDEEEKCPIPTKNVRGYKEGEVTQGDLSNEELAERCPDASAAWESEASAYQAYRWTCDRFLCKSAPARWTENADFAEVRARIDENAQCNAQAGTEGVILRKITDCKDQCNNYDVCYEYEDNYYVYDKSSELVAKESGGEKMYYKLFSCGRSGEINYDKDSLYVTYENGNAFLDELPDSTRECKDICVTSEDSYGNDKKAWSNGECMTSEDAVKKLVRRYYDPKKGEYVEIKEYEQINHATKDCDGQNQMCYCYGTPKVEPGEEANPGDKWDYRLSKTGQVYYPEYRYYKGRDESACFGQDHIIQGEAAPMLNPSDTVPAFQCVCTSQIRNRLVALRNILQGLHGCIYQIKTTGKADHGVCKEMFTQYVCKWMYKLISWLMKGCASSIGKESSEIGIGDYLTAGTQSLFGGVFESTGDLMSDYDSPAVRNYLGVGQEAISNKICLGALTGNWGFDLDGFVDMAYSTPYHTSVQAWPADREYLTWDPDNLRSTYEYKVAWWMTPGCDISSYSVKLSCINQDVLSSYDGASCRSAISENADPDEINPAMEGCDCYNLENEKTHTLYTGRRVSQGQFVNMDENKVITSPYRYDNVKVEIYMADPNMAEKCIPEENRVGNKGVFYFPIKDQTTYDIVACRFDQMTGQFLCDQGGALWEKRGRAYFGDVKCNGEECKTSDENTYYLGDQIMLDPFSVYYSDNRQCLNIQMYNGNNQKLLGEEGIIYDLDQLNEDNRGTFNFPLPLKTVSQDDFFVVSNSNRFKLTQNTPGIEYQEVMVYDTVKTGKINLYIHNQGNDNYEYYISYYDNNQSKWVSRTGWQALSLNEPINLNGYVINVNRLNINSDDNTCDDLSGASRNAPCKKFNFDISQSVTTTSASDQRWRIHMELRHAPGEENEGSCYDSTSEDIIVFQNNRQVKDFNIKVSPLTEPSCITDHGKVCRTACQFYYPDNNKQMSQAYGCGTNKYCCETDISKIESSLENQ